ncbi:MAG: SDR family oxidoreductase [Solirubrobacteraceae bacterium]
MAIDGRRGFDGKVALVTGGASGLGLATARVLAREGAKVVLVDMDEHRVRAAATELGGEAIVSDVSDLDACLRATERASELCGGVDLFHLNAGVATGCGLGQDFSLEAYRRAIGVNLDGVVFGLHAALPALRARGGGAVVVTASLAGLTPMPFDPIYTASKHAVVGLVRAAAPALAQDGIRLNAVCPGFAESKLIEPIREMLEVQGVPIVPAEAVAETALTLLAGETSGECWFVQPGRRSEAFAFRGVPGPRGGGHPRRAPGPTRPLHPV